jgi:2-polyprenyl-3-methyl-5-hydroxy-6-metoxy-1,4-benzoquinol methylase
MMITEWIFPLAFDFFQYSIGGTTAKRELAISSHTNQKHVLEVGCSIGNIAKPFLKKSISYTGIDIDDLSIQYAKKKYKKYKNCTFLTGDLFEQKFIKSFDLIIFSAVLHHIDDCLVKKMLEFSVELLSKDGSICISDPVLPEPSDSFIIKLYRKMERGNHMRSFDQLSLLVSDVKSLSVTKRSVLPVTALPFGSKPVVSKFGFFIMRPRI